MSLYRKYSFFILLTLFMSCNNQLEKVENNKQLTTTEIYENNVNSTVTIITSKGLGSGFFIDSNRIITNYHVIEGSDIAEIVLNNSNKKQKVLGYLAVDKINDLVLLQVSFKSATFIKLENEIPKPGVKVFAIGSPVGLNKTISEGIISGIRDFATKKLLQITAPISHGSSGCPILNEEGKLVGVAVSGIADASNIGFCIPTNFVHTLIDFKENYAQELSILNTSQNQIIPNTPNPAIDNPSNKITSTNAKINNKYLGSHRLQAHFIDCINGAVKIELINGGYYLNGTLKNDKDCWLSIKGKIEIRDLDNFVFTGKIKVHNPVKYEVAKNFSSKLNSPDYEYFGIVPFRPLDTGFGETWVAMDCPFYAYNREEEDCPSALLIGGIIIYKKIN